MEREWGKTPSSMPVRKTRGNSRPLAECSVIRVTPATSSSRASTSATSATESKKASRVTAPASGPGASAWTASRVAMNSSEAATSSSMFSSRASASAVRSALSMSR